MGCDIIKEINFRRLQSKIQAFRDNTIIDNKLNYLLIINLKNLSEKDLLYNIFFLNIITLTTDDKAFNDPTITLDTFPPELLLNINFTKTFNSISLSAYQKSDNFEAELTFKSEIVHKKNKKLFKSMEIFLNLTIDNHLFVFTDNNLLLNTLKNNQNSLNFYLNQDQKNESNSNEPKVIKSFIYPVATNNIIFDINEDNLNKLDLDKIIKSKFGMQNLVNTCFMNCNLQILLHCSKFIHSFYGELNSFRNIMDKSNFILCKELFNLMMQMNEELPMDKINNKMNIVNLFSEEDGLGLNTEEESGKIYNKLIRNRCLMKYNENNPKKTVSIFMEENPNSNQVNNNNLNNLNNLNFDNIDSMENNVIVDLNHNNKFNSIPAQTQNQTGAMANMGNSINNTNKKNSAQNLNSNKSKPQKNQSSQVAKLTTNQNNVFSNANFSYPLLICISPLNFLNTISQYDNKYKTTEQCDSQEFLRTVLNEINTELNRSIIKKSFLQSSINLGIEGEIQCVDDIKHLPLQQQFLYYLKESKYASNQNSIITDLFYSKIFYETSYACGHKDKEYNFSSISEIPLLLDKFEGIGQLFIRELIKDYFRVEYINTGDVCCECMKYIDIIRKVRIASLPQILIFSLQRAGDEFVKNNCSVYIEEIIDLKEVVDEELNVGSTVFRLYGIINHSGDMEGGHYYSYIKIEGEWYKYDDEKVIKEKSIDFCGRNSYIVFYVQEECI